MAESYYRKIKGKNYDRSMLELADNAVSGRGDGRISLSDARKLLKAVKDADSYTDIEKRTMGYIRDNYKFTPESDKWFRLQIRSWAALRGAKKAAKTAKTTKKAVKKAPKKRTSKKKVPDQLDLFPPMGEDSFTPPPPTPNSGPEEERGGLKKGLLLALLTLLALAGAYITSLFFGEPKEKPGPKQPPTTDVKPTPRSQKPANPGKVIKTRIAFLLNSARLNMKVSGPALESLAADLKKKPGMNLELHGHSCSLGNKISNYRLARKRAQEVSRYLIARGVPKERIIIKSHGSMRPIASNNNETGRAQNRRVEFRLVASRD